MAYDVNQLGAVSAPATEDVSKLQDARVGIESFAPDVLKLALQVYETHRGLKTTKSGNEALRDYQKQSDAVIDERLQGLAVIGLEDSETKIRRIINAGQTNPDK